MTSTIKKSRLSARKTRAQSFITQRPNTFKLKPLPNSLMLALASGLFIQAGLAFAQDAKPATENNVTLQSVTVTAQKREEKAQDVPTAISVLGGAELQDKGIGRSSSEILNYVPNASAGTQYHGRPRWWIRGVGAGQQQIDFPNPVGFYRDDVYIQNNTATGFPLFDIDRVEVLRGPQGTLWGKNTTGGAINVISNKPTFKNDGYFKVDYGSYNDRIIQGAVGGTLKEDALAGRLSVYSEEQDGRFNNQFTGQKDGSLKDNNIRGQLTALLSSDLTVNTTLHYRDYKTRGENTTVSSYAQNGVYRNGYVPSTDPNTVSANAPNWTNITQTGGQVNVQYQIGKLAFTSITGYEEFRTEGVTDNDHTPLEIARTWSKAKSQQFSQEFRLASPKTDRINWLAGLYYLNEDIHSDSAAGGLPAAQTTATGFAPQAYNRTVFDHKTNSLAVFGSSTINFTDQLATIQGLRWTTETKSLNLNRVATGAAVSYGDPNNWWNTPISGNYSSTTTNFTTNPTTTWNAVTYDFTPQYKVNKNVLAFFKYAHGIKSGGYNTAPADIRTLNTVRPETLDSYELGLKSNWFGGRLNINANVFHYDYKDVQVNITGIANPSINLPALSYLQNVSQAHADGAELEIEALPTENLHLNANVGYLNTRFDQFDVQNNGGNYNGNQFVRSPHWTAFLAGDYKVPFKDGSKLIFGADYRFLSKQFYYVAPQTADRDLLNQGSYSIANARVSYVLPGNKHTLTAYVNNLNDTIYKNHTLTSNSPATGVTGDTVLWGQRRTYGVSYAYKF